MLLKAKYTHLISACIFDFDGVIVDTADYHYLSWKKLALKLGFEFTKEQNEKMKGISRMASLEVVLDIGNIKASESEKLKMAHVKNEWYKEYLETVDDSIILPGVKSFLAELKTNKIPFVLGSASKNARFVMSKISIADSFDAIFDGNDTERSKPDPEVFLKGAAYLKIAPKDIVVFEDSYKGLVAANAGGFYSCGVGDASILDNANMNIPSFSEFTYSDFLDKISLLEN